MQKRAPTDPTSPCPNSGWNEVVTLESPRPPWPASSRTRKNPICVACGFCFLLLKGPKQGRQIGSERNCSVRLSGFDFADVPNDHTALDHHMPLRPIEIAPLQANEFACPKPEAHRNHTHRAERLHHKLQN